MNRGTILVVDDDPDNRAVCALFLENFGFGVLTAENGYEGVLQARKERPDAILMDLMMPVMDGLEAIELLKVDGDTAQIPVVMVTAHDRPTVRLQAQQAGCDAFLTKPVPPRAILHEVERLLGRGDPAAADHAASAPATQPLPTAIRA